MPIYDYFCEKCQKEYEFLQKLNDFPPLCEIHNIEMKKQISNTFVRRGGGLYSMDTNTATNKEEMK